MSIPCVNSLNCLLRGSFWDRAHIRSVHERPKPPPADPSSTARTTPSTTRRRRTRSSRSTSRALTRPHPRHQRRDRAVVSPINGQPLAHVPQSSDGRRRGGVRARPPRPGGLGARRRSTSARPCCCGCTTCVLDRQDEIIDLIVLGVRQGPQARLRRAAAHRADRALLRPHRRTSTSTPAASRGVVPGLTRVEVNRVPKGVVGIISPWNYPFTMALCDGLPALLAGNAVVAKPDAQTMLTALLGRRAARARRASRGPLAGRRRPGPRDRHRRSSTRADYVCFTGSTATGKIVAAKCAERLIGCSLELGGKNPMLVLRDADLDKAAEGAVRASFSNAGQLCVSTERLFVADQVYDRFVGASSSPDRGDDARRRPRLGHRHGLPDLPGPARHRHRARRGRRRQGCPGAHRRQGPARPRPLLLRADDPRGRHARHDLLRPRDLRPGDLGSTGSTTRPRRSRAPTTASTASTPRSTARTARAAARIARQIKCGTVNINEAYGATFGQLEAPMGGMRESGMGRRQGSRGHPPLHRGRSRSPRSGWSPIRADARDVATRPTPRCMTARLRLLNKLGTGMSDHCDTTTSWSSAPASAARSPRCG